MYRLLLIVALVAHSSLAKPTNCVMFCDDQAGQMGQMSSMGSMGSMGQMGSMGGMGQMGSLMQVPVQTSSVVHVPVQKYSVYTGFNRPTYGLTSSRLQSADVGFVPAGNYHTTYTQPMVHSRVVSPVMSSQVMPAAVQETAQGGLEAMFHQSASQSSQSSSSSLGYIKQTPSISTVVQHEPLRTSAKMCVNEYVDPCF